METIAQEAKRLLSPIPEDEWCIGDFTDGEKCCAIGHWNRMHGKMRSALDSETIRFTTHVGDFLLAKYGIFCTVDTINDHPDDRYPQPTPKQRVIQLLDDMIAAGH